MNSRFGIFLSTVLMLASIALWSVTVLADDGSYAETAVRDKTRQSADDAHREAAADAVKRIREASKLDLDIELIGRTSRKTASN